MLRMEKKETKSPTMCNLKSRSIFICFSFYKIYIKRLYISFLFGRRRRLAALRELKHGE